ncbi:MAG: 2-C-methyl-D-erythritol 4-phosphate cytidylyltransferase [Pseudobutyrivibrio ruminis]|nr:2-C-methyl-D-erythritol 4-phosphate cytidylyltransferase [Pseudobutyrivibrio ruminis]
MNIAILLSGGTGQRLGGDIPKQYIKVEDKPIIIYSLETLENSNWIDKIQIVAHNQWIHEIEKWAAEYCVDKKICGYSAPGENRQMSIYNALLDINAFAKPNDNVFIHDSARPNLDLSTIQASFDALSGYDGVIPVLPMKDTVYLSKEGQQIDALLDRKQVFAGQSPETFIYGKYLKANQRLMASGEILNINGSTEPAILAGMKMHMISGDERNYKITTGDDLDRFKEQIKAK